MAGEAPEGEITIESNLREIIANCKAVSPALARDLRRSLRQSGQEIIADQKTELSKPSRGMAVKTGQRLKMVGGKGGKKQYLRAVNVYKEQAAGRSRSTGMREAIKAGLKTRVVAGKTRSGVSIKAQRPAGSKAPMPAAWNSKVFRHKVFGTDEWVSQYGNPYWWDPIKNGSAEAKKRIEQAINDALNGKG